MKPVPLGKKLFEQARDLGLFVVGAVLAGRPPYYYTSESLRNWQGPGLQATHANALELRRAIMPEI